MTEITDEAYRKGADRLMGSLGRIVQAKDGGKVTRVEGGAYVQALIWVGDLYSEIDPRECILCTQDIEHGKCDFG